MHLVNTYKTKLSFLDVLQSGVRRGYGLLYGIKFAIRHVREFTLPALHALASSGQQFERKRMEKPKTESEKKKTVKK